MSVFDRSKLVPYSAEQMFALVDDVERYQDFLPWCCESRVLALNDNEMRAQLSVSKGPLKLSWVTRNTRDAGRWIEMNLDEGPFSCLSGSWLFDPLDSKASKVSLRLEYELDGSLKRLALSMIFDQIVRSLMQAFIDRAGEIYDR